MNITKLKQAEAIFLDKYPGGFNNPDIQAISKKHKMEKMVSMTRESFSEDAFEDFEAIIENAVKIVSRASLVSVFEKPKFRDFFRQMGNDYKIAFANALRERLHGSEQKGFEMMQDLLSEGKLAKWPLMTILPVYFNPNDDIFVKPTTTKEIIECFELKELVYKPTPSWEFYSTYRDIINEMKTKVGPLVSQNNPAFTGFLMMSMM